MNSQLSRHITARGSSTRLMPVGPTKVKARRSVLFTKATPEVKIRLLFTYCVMTYFEINKKSFVRTKKSV